MSIQKDLRDEFISEVGELSKVEFGSEKYKVGVTGVTQIADRLIEMSRLDTEDEKLAIEHKKLEIESIKIEEDRRDRKIKNRISALGIIAPTIVAIVGGAAMFIYEERGSITSQAGRKIIDKYIFRVK